MDITMTRRTALVVAALLTSTMARAVGTQLLVANVQVQQRPFLAVWDVTYDLETVGDLPATVNLFLSIDGGLTYPKLCRIVAGDVGSGVLPGSSRHIVWNAGEDCPGLSNTTCRLRVTGDDADNLSDYVYVAPGIFMMGSPSTELGRIDDEAQHCVTLTHGVYVQETEVTNSQFTSAAQWAFDHGLVTVAGTAYLVDNLDGSNRRLAYLGTSRYEIAFNNGVFSCVNPDFPVKFVTWYGAAAYCDWLSQRQGIPRAYDHATWQCHGGNPYTASGYRLPTEAEWEFACRSGTTTAFASGPITYTTCSPIDPNLVQVAWYCNNAGSWSHPAAQKQPNSWGLFDMHGNVSEWCNDIYGAYGGAATDPTGLATGYYRVVRGGSWSSQARYCRSAVRYLYGAHDLATDDVGFRTARSAY